MTGVTAFLSVGGSRLLVTSMPWGVLKLFQCEDPALRDSDFLGEACWKSSCVILLGSQCGKSHPDQ